MANGESKGYQDCKTWVKAKKKAKYSFLFVFKDQPSTVEHGYMYRVLASYSAVEGNELSIRQGDAIEILRLGNDGW